MIKQMRREIWCDAGGPWQLIIGNNIMDMDKVMDFWRQKIIRMDFIRMGRSNPTEEEILLICRGPGGKCLS